MGEQEFQRHWRKPKGALGDQELQCHGPPLLSSLHHSPFPLGPPSPLNQCSQQTPTLQLARPYVEEPPESPTRRTATGSTSRMHPAPSVSQFTLPTKPPANQDSFWSLMERRTSRSEIPISLRHRPRPAAEAESESHCHEITHSLPPCTTSPTTLFPWYWLVQQQVGTIAGGIFSWIVDAAAAWLMRKSLIAGEITQRVFPEDFARVKLPNLAPPHSARSKPEVRQVLPAEAEPSYHLDKFQTISEGRLLGGPLVTKIDGDDEESQTLHWLIFTIEVLAVIPVLIIGLSLFYILAIGLYNDVNELLTRLFDSSSSPSASIMDTKLTTETNAPLPSP